MKKFYLSMLMAVGLLISGNLRAQNVAKIVETGNEYATLTEAIAAVEDGVETTIQMIDNDVVEESITDLAITYAYTIPSGKEIVLDLNGQRIYRKRDVNKGYAIFDVKGKLTIDDKSTDKKGELYIFTDQLSSYGASIACVNVGTNGELIVNNGNLICDRPQAGTFYCLDVAAQAKVTINGGLLWNKQKTVIRLGNDFGSSTTLVEFTMNGGKIKGEYGVYCQGAKGKLKATFLGGEIDCLQWVFESENNKAPGTFDNYEITISGGVYNGYFDLGALYDGSAVRQGTQKLLVTGGNFISDNGIRTQNGETAFIKGGIYYFESGKIESLVVHNDVQFISDAEGALCVTYDGYSKWRGDLATKQGWEQLGYIVKPSSDHPDPEGTWWKIYKYTESTENYSNFLTYIADGYMAVDITGQSDGKDGTYPNKTVIVKKVETKEMSGADTWDPEDSGETTAVTIADGANITIPAGTTVEAYSVNVTNGTLNIGEGATLIVGAGGVVEGETININIGNENGSGAIKISPDATTNNRPRVRVNLTTIAHTDTYGAQHWQFFARPTGMKPESFKVLTAAGATNHYISGYNGTTNSYTPITNPKDLGDYEGYAITNNSTNGGVVYQFEGELNPNQNAPITFKNNGFSLMGNSYLAPISIKALFNGIIEEVEPEFEANNSNPTTAPILKAPMGDGENTVEFTVWIYNCKNQRFEQINALKAKSSQLQPMQGFFMKLREGTSRTAAIDYINAVWNNDAQAGPILAPVYNNNGMGSAAIVVSANGCADQIDLFEDAEFDNSFNNGADASKLMNLQGMFNLYAQTEAGTLSCVASDNIEGTILTFQANNASEYELSFSDVENMNYSLIDLTTGNLVEMNEGNVYHFNAIPNSTEARFQIVTAAKAPTAMDKVVNTKVVKGIYSMTGAYLGEAKDFNALPQGVYVVNGEKIVK